MIEKFCDTFDGVLGGVLYEAENKERKFRRDDYILGKAYLDAATYIRGAIYISDLIRITPASSTFIRMSVGVKKDSPATNVFNRILETPDLCTNIESTFGDFRFEEGQYKNVIVKAAQVAFNSIITARCLEASMKAKGADGRFIVEHVGQFGKEGFHVVPYFKLHDVVHEILYRFVLRGLPFCEPEAVCVKVLRANEDFEPLTVYTTTRYPERFTMMGFDLQKETAYEAGVKQLRADLIDWSMNERSDLK